MQHLLLLHGAIGSSVQLEPLANKLKHRFQVHLLNFNGHGGEGMPEEFFFTTMAAQVKSYCIANQIEQAIIFGYSMGGYVGLLLARQESSLVRAVITLATKFAWDEETAVREAAMLNPSTIEQKVPKFAATLAQRHGKVWKEVLEKTARLLTTLGKQPGLSDAALMEISVPVLLMLGDRDQMVTLEETKKAQQKLPSASLAVLPSSPHPIEKQDLTMVSFQIIHFVDSLK